MKTGYHFPTQIPPMNPDTLNRNSQGSAGVRRSAQDSTLSLPNLPLLLLLFSLLLLPLPLRLPYHSSYVPLCSCLRAFAPTLPGTLSFPQPNDLLHSPHLALISPTLPPLSYCITLYSLSSLIFLRSNFSWHDYVSKV